MVECVQSRIANEQLQRHVISTMILSTWSPSTTYTQVLAGRGADQSAVVVSQSHTAATASVHHAKSIDHGDFFVH